MNVLTQVKVHIFILPETLSKSFLETALGPSGGKQCCGDNTLFTNRIVTKLSSLKLSSLRDTFF